MTITVNAIDVIFGLVLYVVILGWVFVRVNDRAWKRGYDEGFDISNGYKELVEAIQAISHRQDYIQTKADLEIAERENKELKIRIKELRRMKK